MKIRFTTKTDNAFQQEKALMKKIELAQVRKQIKMLATFLPNEILQLRQSEISETFSYVGVVLYAHIDGFTELTEKYNKIGKGGVYRLTATLNAYIGALTEVVHFYGGDVLKFTGSAFVILWKVKPEESLYEILHVVVVCGMVVQETLDCFETETNVMLRTKLFVSCGNILFRVIGDEHSRDFVLVGEAIADFPIGDDQDPIFGVIVAPGAWAHMLQERYEVVPIHNPLYKRVTKIFYKPNEADKKRHFDEKHIEVTKLIERHLAHRETLHSNNRLIQNAAQSRFNEIFASTLPTRPLLKHASKRWVLSNLRPFIIKPIQNQVDEFQPVEYLTEVREVTIQTISFSCERREGVPMIRAIQQAYAMISRVVSEMLGIISNTIVFGIDVSIVVLFGLRGRKHEMDSQNALRSASMIKLFLAQMLHIYKMSAGIAIGQVYCGVVGHPYRRQYIVVGNANKKVHKIMTAYPDKIVCDHKTFKNSKLSSFYFRLHYSTVKGEENSLIFEYNESFDMIPPANHHKYLIVGREHEMNLLRSIIGEPEKYGYYSVCFQGPTESGKSAIILRALQIWDKTKQYNIAAVELGAHSKIPYFCVRKIYRQLYDNLAVVDTNNIVPILNLPRELLESQSNNPEDVAVYKYRILNYFRDICICTQDVTTIIFVDNVESIDLQSWEILEIVLNTKEIRLIMSATFEEESFELRYSMSLNDLIKLIEIKPLERNTIACIACQFLEAAGIPTKLVDLLETCCQGRPGHVQICILRLINNGSIKLTLINSNDKNTTLYEFPKEFSIGNDDNIIPLAVLTQKYLANELTLSAISLDLFDSFTPWEQLVIKTGAVLGDIFPRYLMVIALKYPAEILLAKVIHKMFNEQVLQCGSRFVTSGDLEYNKPCCRCHFSEEFSARENPYPLYAYCKLLHFRNKSLKDVAYNLQPGNQRKELHMICTYVLEHMRVQCPRCTREPTTSFFNFGKYKDFIQFCDDPRAVQKPTHCEYGDYGDMRTCVKDFVTRDKYTMLTNYRQKGGLKSRPLFQPDLCNCLEMFVRNFMDLIYHSERAGHLGKRVYFTMQYGFILLSMFDILSGIRVLSEARELCMIDGRTEAAEISDMFRKLLLGRIEIGLAKAHINLRQLKAAKGHLAVSLRQYNIPLVALTYKHFNKLMTRSFLVNSPHTAAKECSNNVAKSDLGACLSLCSKVFAIEGKWEMAKLTASYAIYLLKSTNCNVPVLYDTYCSAIDIYRYSDDTHTCFKLQKFITKEVQLNYANDSTFNLYTLSNLLSSIFEIRYSSGDICAAIRLGYRVLDINARLYSTVFNYNIILFLITLLMLNFRLKDSADLTAIFVANSQKTLDYYTICLGFIVYSSFEVIPFNEIMDFVGNYYSTRTKKLGWEDHLFHSMIQLYYLINNQFQNAEQWKRPCNFDEHNIKRDVVFRTLVVHINIKLIFYIQMRKVDDPNERVEEMALRRLLNLMENQTDRHHKLFKPAYLIQKAYFERIKRNNRTAYGCLNRAIKICDEQNNYLHKCLATKLNLYWKDPTRMTLQCQPNPNFKLAEGFSLTDWSNIMRVFPID